MELLHCSEHNVVETTVLEKNSCHDCEDVLLIGNKAVALVLTIHERAQVIIVDDSFSEEHQKVLDLVDELSHPQTGAHRLPEALFDEGSEKLSDLAKNVLLVVAMLLQNHGEAEKLLEGLRCFL